MRRPTTSLSLGAPTSPLSTIPIARFQPGPRRVAAAGIELLDDLDDVETLAPRDEVDLLPL